MENPTRHKIREAKYFLSMMKQSFEDDHTFAYNLSAFLSAARSITFYMQKQYKRREGFDEWYRQKQIEMSTDPELQCLKEARNEDVKTEPIPTGATREVTMSIDAVLVKEGTQKAEEAKEDEPKPPAQNSPRTVRRFFPKFGHVDVIEFCENQLTKLTRIVEECKNRFP